MKDFAVIFDMDGVIVDSNPAHKEAINKFCRQHNVELTEEKFNKYINGRQNRDWIPALFGSKISPEEIAGLAFEKEKLFREIFEETIRPLPGLESFLKELEAHNIKKAIATSAPKENVAFTLEKTGLQKYFDIILDDRNVKNGKPHPDIYLKTVEAVGMIASKCIVFEDSLAGVESARSAGCLVIGVLTTHTKDELKQTALTIDDFTNLKVEDLERLF